jgi:hypothetical protein
VAVLQDEAAEDRHHHNDKTDKDQHGAASLVPKQQL